MATRLLLHAVSFLSNINLSALWLAHLQKNHLGSRATIIAVVVVVAGFCRRYHYATVACARGRGQVDDCALARWEALCRLLLLLQVAKSDLIGRPRDTCFFSAVTRRDAVYVERKEVDQCWFMFFFFCIFYFLLQVFFFLVFVVQLMINFSKVW